MQKTPRICVVGSCNVDLAAFAPTLPRIGETIKGTSFKKGFGGKGANQAVAAARIGCAVTMIGKVGNDSDGKMTKENFEKNNVDVKHLFVQEDENAFSGVALISVDSEGNNSIVIVPGANDFLLPEEIRSCEEAIAASDFLVCQLEIPLEVSIEAMRLAKKHQVKVLFNTAPAMPLPKEAYSLCDILCLNESELEVLTGVNIDSTPDSAVFASRTLLEMGSNVVIVTLGSQGCLLVTKEKVTHVPVPRSSQVLDTTGAGDCFVGSLVYFLSIGLPLEISLQKANYVASKSVEKRGTQPSFPWKEELTEILDVNNRVER